jgi:LmbE family N-acetylglucosaminyl deacetylase
MLGLRLATEPGAPLKVLALGAHSDDIEIGCGGTIRTLARAYPQLEVVWVVLAAHGVRADEARAGAERFLDGVSSRELRLLTFEDAFFPHEGARMKRFFEELKAEVAPDLVFTHARHDLHQDHRLVCELTWNAFRDHLILEYEIPKFDGDLATPNVFVPLSEELCAFKVEAVIECFPSQQEKHWFTRDVLRGLMALRGAECRSPSRYAEAFYARKLIWS